jgi:hypothetical protein
LYHIIVWNISDLRINPQKLLRSEKRLIIYIEYSRVWILGSLLMDLCSVPANLRGCANDAESVVNESKEHVVVFRAPTPEQVTVPVDGRHYGSRQGEHSADVRLGMSRQPE